MSALAQLHLSPNLKSMEQAQVLLQNFASSSNASVLYLAASGKVGIGNNNPLSTLYVSTPGTDTYTEGITVVQVQVQSQA